MLNVTVLNGRLVKDPEINEFNRDGKTTTRANLTIAVDRDWKDKDGNKTADFFTIIAFGTSALYAQKYLKKGQMIGVEGRLQNRSWEKDGTKHYVTEVYASNVYFCGSGGSSSGKSSAASAAETTSFAAAGDGFKEETAYDDTGLPF